MAWRWILLGVIAVAVIVFGFSLIDSAGNGEVQAVADFGAVETDITGFARAITPREWAFPGDYGAHPDYQTEWWYYTGNVETAEGQHFGYQFTVFRRAITPDAAETDSEWRGGQVYMAHFALTDVEGGQYYHQQRFSRGGAGLAGATTDPRYHVWLESWQVVAEDEEASRTSISADGGEFAVELSLEQVKPPALHGDSGLSPKSAEPGEASYYYSLSRLVTSGTLRVGDVTYTVSGTTWKDHEFSTGALGATVQGWDWFGLQFDDKRELMVGQIRRQDGTREPAFGGLLIEADGSTRYLSSADFTFDVTGQWTSPHTGATYPAGWIITVDTGEADPLRLVVTPLLADQELHGGGGVDYWEGAVRIEGDTTGYGYAELTGYAQAMTGRF